MKRMRVVALTREELREMALEDIRETDGDWHQRYTQAKGLVEDHIANELDEKLAKLHDQMAHLEDQRQELLNSLADEDWEAFNKILPQNLVNELTYFNSDQAIEDRVQEILSGDLDRWDDEVPPE